MRWLLIRISPSYARVAAGLAALVVLTAAPLLARAAQGDRWQAIATPVFRDLSSASGLSSASEPDVFATDGEGFMWVGTQSGLLRWDGYHFKRYVSDDKRPDGLPDNYINSLHRDRFGQLWIGTNVGGLARYDRAHDNFVRYGARSGLAHATVAGMADDGANGLWIGSDNGLDHIDIRGGQIVHTRQGPLSANALPSDAVTALMRDHAGSLWIGTPVGLFRRSPRGRFEAVALPRDKRDPMAVTSLFEDSRQRIWIGTLSHGLFLLAPGSAAAVPFHETAGAAGDLSSEHVPTIGEAGPDQIWVGTYGHGVVVIDAATMKTHRIERDISVTSSLCDNTILNIARDPSGLIWLATNRCVAVYNPSQTAVLTVFGPSSRPHGLTNGDIQSVGVMPDGRLWLGLGADGVDIFSPSSDLESHLAPDPRHPETTVPATFTDAISAASGGKVYLGTGRGLYRVDTRTKAVTRVPLPSGGFTRVRTILWRGGFLWVGEHGLTRFRLGADGAPIGKPDHLTRELSDPQVSVISPGPGDTVWVGTHRGLNRLSPDLRVLDRVSPSDASDGLSPGGIDSMLTDRAGRLWIASTGSGVNVLLGRDAKGRMIFRHIGVDDGLPDANVDQLLQAADGVIWASTDDGLAKIDPHTFAVSALQGRDGVHLTSYWDGSGAVTPEGELLFGGVGGLTVLRPDALIRWPYKPPIVVTDADRGGKPLLPGAFETHDGGRGLSISPDANSFRIEFAALDYSAPDFNRYKYRLVGYDDHWIETDGMHRVAAYTNLWPGHYELRLLGTNRDGVWSDKTLNIPITVLPHWYQTPLFYLFAVLLAIAAVSGIVIWRTAGLRRQHQALEAQVAERTAQLREQTELALAANKAKSAFLAMMSHELRTPMNGVLGMARALKMTALDEEQNRHLDMIVRSGDGLMTILNDILDISKIEAGKLELEFAPFDLIEIGRTAFDLWSETAAKKGVELVYDVDPATPRWVQGDPTRVRQIVLNLVSNALKFTQAGQVRLSLAPAEAGVRIQVSDTGIGISPDQQTRLFQSFSQAEASTSRRFGGTGLGLAICKQLADLMGGGITLRSVVGEGATFTVDLPLPLAEPPEAVAKADNDDGAMPLENVRLLVVDDNAVNLAVASAILGAMGAQITTADDGLEAVDRLSWASFDVVLMDLQMPRMNGSEALAVIRAGGAGRADIPVIALTANVMAGETARLLSEGFDDVQPKPISPEGLIGSILRVLEERAPSSAVISEAR